MYYIYHIPNVKIGCSTQPNIRIKKQGYSDYKILEEHTDIDIASKREIELQKQYGYKVDTKPYYETIKMCSAGGKATGKLMKESGQIYQIQKKYAHLGGLKQGLITGKKNAESGHISALGKKNSEFNNRIRTCPHCGITTRGVGYERWHGDRCKKKVS